MIPPNKYITFSHMYTGSFYYKGPKKEHQVLYDKFLADPDSNQFPELFNNILSKTEEKVLRHGQFCVVFILDTDRCYNHDEHDHWPPHTKNLDIVLKYVKKADVKLIKAWDIYFEKVDHLLNRCAIVGIESIMKTPFDKSVMVPGNIFITENGEITHNYLTIDDAINKLALKSLSINLPKDLAYCIAK